MKWWLAMSVAGLLAGCGGAPQVVPTSTSPQAIALLVEGARFVPLREVLDRAQHHCAAYGRVARRTQAKWVDGSAMTFNFACVSEQKPPVQRAASKAATAGSVGAAPTGSKQTDQKQAAWAKARTLAQEALTCLSHEAGQQAGVTGNSVATAAEAAAARCARWEHDMHAVLQSVGEDDSAFQASLHQQILALAAARIETLRAAPAGSPFPLVGSANLSDLVRPGHL